MIQLHRGRSLKRSSFSTLSISNWIIRIKRCCCSWCCLHRSVASSAEIRRKKSFKKKNFVSRVQVKSEWVIIKRRGRGEMNERERFPDCLPVFVRALSACGVTEGTFRFSRVCSFLSTILFLVQVRWTRVVPIKLASWIESPLGPRSIPRLSRQFWAESGSSGDISGSRKGGEMSLEHFESQVSGSNPSAI